MQIHNLTKLLYESYITEKVINPSKLAELYERIEIVNQASPEVEKVINYFNWKKQREKNEHRNLDKLTFKFIFGNDKNKVKFIISNFRIILKIYANGLCRSAKMKNR